MKVLLLLIVIIMFIAYVLVKWLNKNNEINQVETGKEEVGKTSEENVKRIEFTAVGTADPIEGDKTGQDILQTIVDRMKTEGYFQDEYQAMTDEEIKQETSGEKVYELSADNLIYCDLELEDNNRDDPYAIKVLAGLSLEPHHIGYVPKEHSKEIRELMEKYDGFLENSLYGGKFKYRDYDEYGKEEIVMGNSPYGIRFSIAFRPKHVE